VNTSGLTGLTVGVGTGAGAVGCTGAGVTTIPVTVGVGDTGAGVAEVVTTDPVRGDGVRLRTDVFVESAPHDTNTESVAIMTNGRVIFCIKNEKYNSKKIVGI
jgi:hypothetical protein